MKSQGKLLPSKLERQPSRYRELPKQKLPQEPVLGQENLNSKLQIAGGSVWIRLRVKRLQAGLVLGVPLYFCILPPRALSGSHSYDWRTEPLCFWQDEGENSHSEICPEHSVLNKAFPQEKLTRPNLLGFYQA